MDGGKVGRLINHLGSKARMSHERTINWGILGCGNIAHKVADDLGIAANAALVAVGSKDQQRANDFGERHGVANCYGSYEALVCDPQVEVIYVATRHPQHLSASLAAMQRGKAVLCEKPLAMNLMEVRMMTGKAQQENLFLMEAIWTRFIPVIHKTLALIDAGTIGEIKNIQADFGFLPDISKERLFKKSMGGGALLDIGIYPLFISLLILGMPSKLQASAVFIEQQVDQSCTMILEYAQGAVAVLHATFAVETTNEAWIHGTAGSIQLHRPFHAPSELSIVVQGKVKETMSLPLSGNGYVHEVDHVNDCLRRGLVESPLLPHELSLNLMQLLDDVRVQVGLDY